MVEAAPAAALEMPETNLLFKLAPGAGGRLFSAKNRRCRSIAGAFDAPAQLGGIDQLAANLWRRAMFAWPRRLPAPTPAPSAGA
jgi:hypothetical protein